MPSKSQDGSVGGPSTLRHVLYSCQDGNHKGEVSSVGKRLDWLGEGTAQACKGLEKGVVSLKAGSNIIKA